MKKIVCSLGSHFYVNLVLRGPKGSEMLQKARTTQLRLALEGNLMAQITDRYMDRL